MTQPEIGGLVGKSKTWVNRRLTLAEALSEALQADLRLGLLSATTARELCRLPRDNQEEVATIVAQRGLTTRQALSLVEAWLCAPTELMPGHGLQLAWSRSRRRWPPRGA